MSADVSDSLSDHTESPGCIQRSRHSWHRERLPAARIIYMTSSCRQSQRGRVLNGGLELWWWWGGLLTVLIWLRPEENLRDSEIGPGDWPGRGERSVHSDWGPGGGDSHKRTRQPQTNSGRKHTGPTETQGLHRHLTSALRRSKLTAGPSGVREGRRRGNASKCKARH